MGNRGGEINGERGKEKGRQKGKGREEVRSNGGIAEWAVIAAGPSIIAPFVAQSTPQLDRIYIIPPI